MEGGRKENEREINIRVTESLRKKNEVIEFLKAVI